jgi:hypothetical protein
VVIGSGLGCSTAVESEEELEETETVVQGQQSPVCTIAAVSAGVASTVFVASTVTTGTCVVVTAPTVVATPLCLAPAAGAGLVATAGVWLTCTTAEGRTRTEVLAQPTPDRYSSDVYATR